MIELLIVLLPLLAAIVAGFVRCPRIAQAVTTASMSLSALCSWYVFITFDSSYYIKLFSWLTQLHVDWGIYVDSLTIVMLVVVTTVSAVVHFYSIGYMAHEGGKGLFFSYLSLFTFFMIVLVTANNFLQMFVGWEGVGLCSYLLIGFWFQKFSATKAAMKAFIVNRIGDFCLLIGMLLIFWRFGSLNFNAVFESAGKLAEQEMISILGCNFHVIHLICVLLFVGCMGKSAQLGLHVWLPDAMEGPTPVSALIHAATMVTAGVFLVVRCSPLFELSVVARDIMAVVGALTAFFAATVAITQTDIKKVIAYSTCSQLGYMFIACGVSAYNIAIFHLMTHAFFKALLFLCAGNVIHSMNGQQDITRMGGQCWRKMIVTYGLMMIGSLAIMGIFPFAGFYSKDLIVEYAYQGNLFAFWVAAFVVFLTAFYSWRLLLLVFHGNQSIHAKPSKKNIHESPWIMLVPLFLLAFGSIFSGMWGNSWATKSYFWKESIKLAAELQHSSPYLQLLPIVLSVFGIALAHLVYAVGCFKDVQFKSLFNFCYNKWYFDEIYHYLYVKPIGCVANFLWKAVDVGIIDYFGPNGMMRLAGYCAKKSVRLQTGHVFDYAFVMLLGLIVVVFWILMI